MITVERACVIALEYYRNHGYDHLRQVSEDNDLWYFTAAFRNMQPIGTPILTISKSNGLTGFVNQTSLEEMQRFLQAEEINDFPEGYYALEIPGGKSLDMNDKVYFLGQLADVSFLGALLTAEYYEDASDEKRWIPVRLPYMVYRLFYQPSMIIEAELRLPNGEFLTADENGLKLYGTRKMYETIQDKLNRFDPADEEYQYPLHYAADGARMTKSVSEMLWDFLKRASLLKGEMYLADPSEKEQLRKISSSWMLDGVEDPELVLIKKGSEWAAYHFDRHCALETSEWFFEPDGFLSDIFYS